MAVNPTRSTWRRLKRNKGAVFGIIVIILSVLVAIFAHLIAPDPSPDANRMIVEIDGKKPGYTQQFFKLPRQGEFEDASFFKRLVGGREDKFTYIPINGYSLTSDSLI